MCKSHKPFSQTNHLGTTHTQPVSQYFCILKDVATHSDPLKSQLGSYCSQLLEPKFSTQQQKSNYTCLSKELNRHGTQLKLKILYNKQGWQKRSGYSSFGRITEVKIKFHFYKKQVHNKQGGSMIFRLVRLMASITTYVTNRKRM